MARLVARRSGPLAGEAALPGDKSLSHRALILAALAHGESRIAGLADGDDVRRTIAALRAFGRPVEATGEAWRVVGGAWTGPPQPIDCGNAGTAARLLIGAAAGQGVAATFDGDASLRRRPMARIVAPLRAMGARIAGADHLPVTLAPARLRGLRHVEHLGSAQVKSALLFAGLGATGRTSVVEPYPSRDHGERLLPLFGVPVRREGGSVSLDGPAVPRAATLTIPGDLSAAAFPLVAALLVPGSAITLRGVGLNPRRTGLLDALAAMGAAVAVAERDAACWEPRGDIAARASPLRGVTIPAEQVPRTIDEYPILAIAAACAGGETALHGLGELRVKESDRLAALLAGLTACGVRARVEGDTLIVAGGPVAGGVCVDSRGDHRIAMAFLVLGLVSAAPIAVDGAQMIATSFPGFPALMRGLGARIDAA